MKRHLSHCLLLAGFLAASPAFAAPADERLIAAARDGIDGTVAALVAAHADAKAKSEALMAEEMKSVTGGMALPPGMKLPF